MAQLGHISNALNIIFFPTGYCCDRKTYFVFVLFVAKILFESLQNSFYADFPVSLAVYKTGA